MTRQLRESYAGLERKVQARTLELTEALEQQTGQRRGVEGHQPHDLRTRAGA